MDIFEAAYEANRNGRAFTLPFDALDPAGADDFVGYIRNDAGAGDIIVWKFRGLVSGADSTIELCTVTAIEPTGTFIANEGVSMSGGGGLAATVKSSLNITAIAAATVVKHFEMDSTQLVEQEFIMHEGYRIPPGKNVALRIETGTSILTGSLDFFFEPEKH